ncbi:MAG: succinate dehydrogenase cytochrome b subunit [Acidobacteriota bacterium]
MNWFASVYRSAVGKKAAMAISGIVLFGFVFTHMTGNLKVFQGAEKFNAYAEWLREIGAPLLPHSGMLWILRIGLLAAVVIHIASAIALVRLARKARPEGYRRRDAVQMDYAVRTMRWGGVLIALYVVYHLMHLTFGNVHGDFIPGDVYHNVVTAFQNPLVAGVYAIANLALGFHLYHGLWSLFQSLGWNHPRFNPWRRAFATAFAVIVTVGFISVPLAVLTGLVS